MALNDVTAECQAAAAARVEATDAAPSDRRFAAVALAAEALRAVMRECTSEHDRSIAEAAKALRKQLRHVQPADDGAHGGAQQRKPPQPSAEGRGTPMGAGKPAAKPAAGGVSPRLQAVDFGQYDAHAFKSEVKAEKFARLMGGGKEHARVDHATHALSPDEQRAMEKELERQYTAATHHKGKKGLGL